MKAPSSLKFVGDESLNLLSTTELERPVPIAVFVVTDGALKVVWCEAVQGYEWIIKVINHFLESTWHFGDCWDSLRIVFEGWSGL